MVNSINPTSPVNNTQYPDSNNPLADEYKKLYEAFANDPTRANAQALKDFLDIHRKAIDYIIGEQGEYKNYPNMKPDDFVNTVENLLKEYIEGADPTSSGSKNPFIAMIIEFGDTLGTVMGAYSPSGDLQATSAYPTSRA
jgi:hypothetical protein